MKRTAALLIAGLLALLPFLAACGGGGHRTATQQATYCTTADGQIVDPSYCDSGYGGSDALMYYLLMSSYGGHHYHVGQTISHTYVVHATRIDPRSASARAAAGLPRTGPVSPGYRPSTSSKPSTASKPSTSKPSTASKPSTGSVKPAPKPQAPKPPAPKPPAPKPPAPAPKPPPPPPRR